MKMSETIQAMDGAVPPALTGVAWAADRRRARDPPDLICPVLAEAAHRSVAFSDDSAVLAGVQAVSSMLEQHRERTRWEFVPAVASQRHRSSFAPPAASRRNAATRGINKRSRRIDSKIYRPEDYSPPF